MARIKIAVAAFDGINPFLLSIPSLIFGAQAFGDVAFDVEVIGVDGADIATSAGFRIGLDKGLEALAGADLVIVPSWRTDLDRPDKKFLDALNAAAASGARIVGLCLGAFVLAEAGLLDDRKAATHWAYADAFHARFRRVKLVEDALYVDEGPIVTSAGVAAGLDCCLHILRGHVGVERAGLVARGAVLAPHRLGGQAQFVRRPLPQTGADHRLRKTLDEIRANLAASPDVDAAAKRTGLSRRSFTRHFRTAMGLTYVEWLTQERVQAAQSLIETTRLSLAEIAAHAGFNSPVAFTQAFRKLTGLTPNQWKASFRRMAAP